MNKKFTHWIRIFCLVPCLYSCWPSFQAEYVNSHNLELIDDRWTQSDIDKIGQLIEDLNKKVRLNPKKFGTNPTVIFTKMENRTDEHIDTLPIKNKIMDGLINSDSFSFVDADALKTINQEINYQQKSGMVDQATAAEIGKQTGADLLLRGSISNNVNQQDNRKIVTYQVSLTLTSIAGGTILWTKQYSSSKDMKKASVGW